MSATVPHPRRRALLGLIGAAPLLAACGTSDPLSSSSSSAAGASSGAPSGAGSPSGSAAGGGTVTVGSANFAESEIIGELYAQAMEAKGVTVKRQMQIGAREVYLKALEDGSIDVVAEYNGNLLGFYDDAATTRTTQEVDAALKDALPAGLELLDTAQAEDKDTYCVTSAFSQENGITSFEDLKDYQGTLRVGGPPEMTQRGYGAGLPQLEKVYGLPQSTVEFTPISDGGGPLTVRALVQGDVDAVNLFSTTPAIKDNGFVALEDPKGMITPQNVVPLVAGDRVGQQARDAINAVQAQLTTDDLLTMNGENQGDAKKQPAEVAAAWLKEKGLA